MQTVLRIKTRNKEHLPVIEDIQDYAFGKWKQKGCGIQVYDEQIPENIEDVKVLLDELKIKYTTYYTNEKDFVWTAEDKVKILRAINIEFKTKFCGEFSAYSCCIGNKNDITIRKYKYQGQELVSISFSTMEQVWNMFKNIYKDVKEEI